MLLTLDSTSVFVTHDQSEAMVLADRIAVMNKGRILQTGSPQVESECRRLGKAHSTKVRSV